MLFGFKMIFFTCGHHNPETQTIGREKTTQEGHDWLLVPSRSPFWFCLKNACGLLQEVQQ